MMRNSDALGFDGTFVGICKNPVIEKQALMRPSA